MDTIIQQVIDLLKTLSPALWKVLVKQVYVEGFSQLAWSLVVLIIGVVFVRMYYYAKGKAKADRFSDWNGLEWVWVICAIIAGLATTGLLVGSLKWIANPDFYAVRWLLEKVTGN